MKFNNQMSQYKQQKPIQNTNQGPVQNFNLYDQSINEHFNKKDNDQIKLDTQNKLYALTFIKIDSTIDPKIFFMID